jgi:hypothetical protein
MLLLILEYINVNVIYSIELFLNILFEYNKFYLCK